MAESERGTVITCTESGMVLPTMKAAAKLFDVDPGNLDIITLYGPEKQIYEMRHGASRRVDTLAEPLNESLDNGSRGVLLTTHLDCSGTNPLGSVIIGGGMAGEKITRSVRGSLIRQGAEFVGFVNAQRGQREVPIYAGVVGESEKGLTVVRKALVYNPNRRRRAPHRALGNTP
jgi:hypothetical protein